MKHLYSDLQMNSDEYQEIIQFLHEQKYPETVQKKLSSYSRPGYSGGRGGAQGSHPLHAFQNL